MYKMSYLSNVNFSLSAVGKYFAFSNLIRKDINIRASDLDSPHHYLIFVFSSHDF
jgi:hypothetical protein